MTNPIEDKEETNHTVSYSIMYEEEEEQMRIGLPPALRYTFISAYSVLFVVGVVSNLLVIGFVLAHKSMQTMTNKFLTNLSLADLLIVLVCIPVTASSQYFYEQWELGALLCQATSFIHAVAVSVSVLSLTAVSLDRYLIICQPIRARSIITKCRIRLTLAIIWLVSLCLMSPLLFVFKYEQREIQLVETNETFSVKKCFEVWPSLELKLTFEILLVLVLLVLPALFMIKTFMRIRQNLWLNSFMLTIDTKATSKHNNRHSSLIGRESVFSTLFLNQEDSLLSREKQPSSKLLVVRSSRDSSNTDSLQHRVVVNNSNKRGSSSTSKSYLEYHDCIVGAGGGGGVRYSSRNEMAIIKLVESRKRVVKSLILLTSLFLLSWLPYHITSILIDLLVIWERQSSVSSSSTGQSSDYSPGPWARQTSIYVYPFTLLLALTNSTTNPLCFILLSHRFRSMLKSHLTRRSCCFKRRLDDQSQTIDH